MSNLALNYLFSWSPKGINSGFISNIDRYTSCAVIHFRWAVKLVTDIFNKIFVTYLSCGNIQLTIKTEYSSL
jgi:hypothetical protein